MENFIKKLQRSVELPLGCKELIDVDAIRNWSPVRHPHGPTVTSDQLAYMEGHLAGLLKKSGRSYLVCVGRHEDRGMVMVIPDSDLIGPLISATWNGVLQERAVRAVLDGTGTSPLADPVGRWKASKKSLKYPLPPDPSMAARLIGQVFRLGYDLGDLASITLVYHETKTA